MSVSHDARGPKRRQAVTIRVYNDAKREIHLPQYPRPETRADCLEGGFNSERPCPYVGCKHHLFLSVGSSGNITLNFPDAELEELPQTCALDVADSAPTQRSHCEGHRTLAEVGELLGVTREAVRNIQSKLFRIAKVKE